jgi:hypothetical protein
VGTSPPPGTTLFVSPDLTYFETASPGSYADDVTVSGVPHRRLDAAYYAWLRHKMDLARRAVAARRLSAATFEGLRERFNVLHALAVGRLGAPALAAAVKSFDPRRYEPPRPDDDLGGARVRAARPPAGPSGHAFPASGDWRFTEPVDADAIAKVDAVRDAAIALGWTEAGLYGNRGHLRFPYARGYGLVCFLDGDAAIGEVTRESIEIVRQRGARTRFRNPDAARLQPAAAGVA